jgi:hypothetical protein
VVVASVSAAVGVVGVAARAAASSVPRSDDGAARW